MLNRLRALHLPAPVATLADRTVARLPPLAAHVLAAVPSTLEHPVLERLINHALAGALAAGDFRFLDGRTVAIHVTDSGWSMTLSGGPDGRIQVLDSTGAETRISATARDFLSLAAGHLDPDTLFFQRRLRIEGNVALGLEVKNTLDGVERESFPRPLRAALKIAQLWLGRSDRSFEGPAHTARTLSSPGRPYQ